MTISRWLGLILLASTFLPHSPALAEDAVILRQEPLVIPTYRVGPPERTPLFFAGRSYQGAKGPIYPYPLLDKLSDIREDKTYNAIRLENRYVQYQILPELGGRIFTGQDKTNRYDFLYRQHVIKPALIGMVGAWISGGVEWNIPHHHRASTFMPVQHRLVDNPDGSRTVWLGETELRHRMRWIVGLTLYPDKSTLRVTVKMFNRTPLPHSMLYFANIAVHANPDYQVIFPPRTEFGTQHGKSEFVHWPVGRGMYGGQNRAGIDLSWWKNLPTPASIFAWNYEDDFFGGYDHGKQAGLAVIADHHIAPGKKFFEWGMGPEGAVWDKILTDADGPYLELMAGGYSDNQPDYSWVQPTEVRTIEQFFYPIRQLGGIKNANTDAAVNLDVKNNVARIAFNTTAAHKEARILLASGNNRLLDRTIAISPDAPFSAEVPLPPGLRAQDLRASLADAAGRELIAYQTAPPANSPMPARVEPPPAPKDIQTAEELYLAGLRLEQFHSPAREPEPYYEEALRRDPSDTRANIALGILAIKRGTYDTAEKHLRAAIARATRNYTSPKDTEAFYYLGIALRRQHKLDPAADAFQKAAWSPAWRGPANHALAEIASLQNRLPAALEFIDRALAVNAANTRAMHLRAALLRKLNHPDDAAAQARLALAVDPLDPGAIHEMHLARQAPSLPSLPALLHNDPNAHLELAMDYAAAGLYDDTIALLTDFLNIPSAEKSPLIHYDLGYFHSRRGNSANSASAYRAAASAPADGIFPFQMEMIDILSHASAANRADARAPYYLGTLLYDHQPALAITLWEKSRQIDPAFAPVHRNLAFAYSRHERNPAKAIAALESAIALDSRDARYFAELDALYESTNVDPARRLALLEQHHDVVAQRDDALLREISLHILLGHYDRAIALFGNRHFRLWEGETGIHDIYADAHLLRGLASLKAGRHAQALADFNAAQTYPDTLETAKPARGGGKLVQVNYCLGLVYDAMNQPQQARAHYEQAANARIGNEWSDLTYYQALALRKIDQEPRAIALFDRLIRLSEPRTQATDEMDFFTKFGARQSPNLFRARAHYLLGLGHLGKGNLPAARAQFQSALNLHSAHLGARTALQSLPGDNP